MNCTKCNSIMIIRDGPYGEFMACPLSTRAVPHPTASCSRDPCYVEYDMDYESEMYDLYDPSDFH